MLMAYDEPFHIRVKAMRPATLTFRRLGGLVWPGALFLLVAWGLQQEESVRQATVPYARYVCLGALAAAALLSWYHNYARVLCAAVVVGLTVWSLGWTAAGDDVTRLAAVILLPLNFALLGALKERGLATFDGFLKIVFIGAQVFFVRLLAGTNGAEIDAVLWWRNQADMGAWIPWAVHLSFAVTAILLLVLVLVRRTNVEAGLLWGLAAVFAGLNRSGEPGALYFYCGSAGLVLMFSVLEHGFEMAYRDELTGLPGRRAFNEVLQQLRRRYTIVMCDVDHFKAFNDTYGHDAGDKALKAVATTLLGVRGGGRAFRFGGEEFALVFKGRSAAQVEPFVDALREEIARMGFAPNSDISHETATNTTSVNITISIGVADSCAKHVTPEQVLESADVALYRAKESGRNCVKLAET